MESRGRLVWNFSEVINLLLGLVSRLKFPFSWPRHPFTVLGFRPQHGGRRSLASELEGYFICIWEFPKIGGTLFWVLIIRILLFRVLY